jgi:hypothetical protein
MSREYAFDLRLLASVRVVASSEETARAILRDTLDCATANFGALPDGTPLTGEVGQDGDAVLFEVDGEPTEAFQWMPRTTAPTIHINGTDRASLVEQYDDAYSAITEAIAALNRAAPNGRDYYVRGPGAYSAAQLDHTARLAKLEEVRKELEAIREAIADQVSSF